MFTNTGGFIMSRVKAICFSNTARFLFNKEEVIVLNRLNGQWIKIPKQCYEILKLCDKEALSLTELNGRLADDDDRSYMKQLVELLDSMECLYNDAKKVIDNISIAITHRCNLKCIHCMVDAEFGGGNEDYFNTQTMCSFLDKIIAVNPRSIALTGGEPMLRPDFLTILEYLRNNYNGVITLMTNGTLFTPDNVDAIISRVNSIDISLDGADKQSCAVIRGQGVFEKVVSNIKLLKSKGFNKINISMVLSNNNARYTKQFFELNKSLETTPILRALSYDGRAKDNKDTIDNTFTIEQIPQGMENDTAESRSCCCTAGYNQLTIEANGDIFPCNLFVTPEFKLGNMNEIENLSMAFYTNEGFFVSPCVQCFEPSEFPICKDCNINYFCWSCVYPMFRLDEAEFKERCEYKKRMLANIWE